MATDISRDRRVIPARNASWAQRCAAWCVRRGISANRMSVWSLVASGGGAVALAAVPHVAPASALCAAAVVAIQLRLLANMLDGMIADRTGGTPVGALFNEIPDRLADVLILSAAGLALGEGGLALGLLAALAALATAYVRGTASLVGAAAPFHGPMAKPQRMMLLSAALALAAVLPAQRAVLIAGALGIIAAGSVITCVRRVRRIAGSI